MVCIGNGCTLRGTKAQRRDNGLSGQWRVTTKAVGAMMGGDMGSDIKCKCARLERTSTGSLVTIANSVACPTTGEEELLSGGLTFDQWEFIATKFFPGWELVCCANDFEEG